MGRVADIDTHKFAKLLVGLDETDHGPNLQWIDSDSRFAFDKIASLGTYVPPRLADFISKLHGTLPHDKVAFYNRALGSFESYGINKNGDGFKRSELIRKHATFVDNAKYFRHHQNREGCPFYGQPVASEFNDKTDIVDLIIVADKLACMDEIQRLERGESVPTSMGAKVAYDICFICDNKARNRMEYCEHVKVGADAPYGMGNILDDGQICGVDNPDPRFFDISKVIVPAAKESEHLMKVANARHSYELRGIDVHSAIMAEHLGITPKLGENKGAAMVKEVPGDIEGAAFRQALPRVEASEKDLPDATINKAVERGGMSGLMRNTAAMGIVLKPDEFKRGVERASGSKVASFLPPNTGEIESSDGMHESVFGGPLDSVVLRELDPFFEKRSVFYPALLNRIRQLPPVAPVTTKEAGEPSGKVREMYVAYRAEFSRNLGMVGGQDAETWVAKTAGTYERLLGRLGVLYAKLAFTSFDQPSLQDRIVLRAKKFANNQNGPDNVPDRSKVSGTIAEDIGEEALDLIAVQSLLHTA